MDCNAPNYAGSDTAQDVKEAGMLADYVISKDCDRIMPSVTPRFIPTCSTGMMKGANRQPCPDSCNVASLLLAVAPTPDPTLCLLVQPRFQCAGVQKVVQKVEPKMLALYIASGLATS